MLYVLIVVRKFHLRLLINERKKLSYAVIETHVFDRTYMPSPPTVVASVKGLYPRRACQLRSLK